MPTPPRPDDARAIRDAFLKLHVADLQRRQPRSLAQYQKLFPGYEEDIADEFARLEDSTRAGATSSEAAVVDTLPASEPDEVPQQIGPYRVLSVLGEGGMGTVYLAEQREPVRRRVALKVIKLGMDSKQVLARFEAERQALALMNHDNIARVYDAGTTERGQPFFVMEHVEGVPLTQYCDQHKLTIQERIALFQQACAGVQHAHQKGVIHRDLKPSNVLVTRREDKAIPKIIDFGLARATDHQLIGQTLFTEQGQILGTPEYMSPEQAGFDAQGIDTRTDIYSLGVMLYELLAGELPFSAKELRQAGMLEIQRKIREDQPPKPSTRVSTLGASASERAGWRRTSTHAWTKALRGDLDWIVLKAMAKEPERRYESATGMAMDLGRFLEHQPVLAGPPGVGYRVRKFVRRYRLQVGAAITVLVTLVAGVIGTAWFAVSAREQAGIAERKGKEASDSATVAQQRLEDANKARDEAKASAAKALTTQSLFLADLANAQTDAGDALTGALLALEALPGNTSEPERPYVLQAESALYRAVLTVQESVELPRQVAVTVATFLPDGRSLLTSDGFTTWLWDLQGRQLAALRGAFLDFSPVGQRIATQVDSRAALLWDMSGNEVGVVRGKDEPGTPACIVETLAFSTDANRILTVGNHEARLWDGQGTELCNLGRIDGQDGESIRQASISPDGSRIVTTGVTADASGNRVSRAWLWDAEGNHIAALGDKSSRFESAVFGAGGRRAITLSSDNALTLWDLEGKKVGELPGVRSGQFSLDGQRLLTLCLDGTAGLLDGEFRSIAVLRHAGGINSGSFSADGSRILTTSPDGTAQLWDAHGQQTAVLVGHGAAVRSATFDPAMRNVLTASDDGTARLWDTNGQQLAVLGKYGGPIAAGFSADGRRVLTASGTLVRLWDVTPTDATVLGERGTIAHAEFSPDGSAVRVLARTTDAVSADEEVLHRLDAWDLNGRPMHRAGDAATTFPYRPAHPGAHMTIVSSTGLMLWRQWFTVNANGSRILTYRYHQGVLRLWDSEGNEVATLVGHHAAFSPDGRSILSTPASRDDPLARLLDRDGHETLVLRGHEDLVSYGAFRPDGQRIVTASADKTARVWDLQGKQLAVLRGHDKNITYAVFSPDGSRILTAAYDGTARMWLADGTPVARLSHFAVVYAAFSPDGSLAVTTSRDKQAMVWDLDGKRVGVLRGHTNGVWSAAISPDNQFVVTGADDGTARLWHPDGRQIVVLGDDASSVAQASFSPDGRSILTVTGGTARLLPLYSTQALIERARQLAHRQLTPQQRVRFYLGKDPVEQVLDELFDRHILTHRVLAAIDAADLPARELDRARSLARSRPTPSAAELNTRAWRAAGRQPETQRDLAAALRFARAAVELAPESPNFRATLARMLARNGHEDEAPGALARAVELAEASAVKMFGFTSKPPDQAAADKLGVDPGGSLIVTSVSPGSTAECADLRPGDIITAVAGAPANPASLAEAKASRDFFATVPLAVRRDAMPMRVDLLIGARAKTGYLTLNSGGMTTNLPEPGGRPPASTPGYTKTGLWFVNGRDDLVSVDWVDFNGDRQTYFRLPPGEVAMPSTVPGHVWVVAAGDRVLGTVVVPNTPRQVARVDIK